MNADVEKAFGALVALSKDYPSEEFIVRVKDGVVAIGIPKGEVGDRAEAAWNILAIPALKLP